MKFSLLLGVILVCNFSGLQAQDANQLIQENLLLNREQSNLSASDTEFEITNEHVSTLSGIHHIYYRQAINDIPVLGTESGLHLKNGKIFAKDNRFIQNINAAVRSNAPSITSQTALLNAAASEGYNVTNTLNRISENNTTKNVVYSNAGISLSDIPVSLAYKVVDESVYLVWDISIQEKAQEHWYNIQVDANTGVVISKFDWMTQCSIAHDHSAEEKLNFNLNLIDIPNYEATVSAAQGCTDCYEVFAMPIISPYFGSRTIESMPSNIDASPFGWHDINGVAGADFTTTRGNNTNSYEDGDNSGYQPDGGDNLDFTGYPFDQAYSTANQYEDAAITNLFYWNNTIHDVMYQYGFDPNSGNFQENNYGQGGAGSDSVNAEAQDNSGECNANFGTPPDGGNPTMQMYTCNSQDGDFDALVIVHEYGHGISNRLTGGAANAGCLSGNEQMGEGWSDYYGIMLTMKDTDMPGDVRAVGTYLFGQGPNGNGIRSFPYSTDLGVNPHTYDDIMTESLPHGVGSVWAAMLWEMTWNLIDAHGFSDDFLTVTGDVDLDAGNIQAMLLVTEGLKLQPCAPGFVDGRDAILAADVALYGGANECLIWDAFAKRGLGFSADQGSSASRADGTEAFDTPSNIANFTAPADLCQSSFVISNATGGMPFGGVYSGPGVTDNGDGYSYTFNPATAGPGVHTITYIVQDGNCSIASSDSDTVEVFFAADPPTTTDALLVCLNEEVSVTATLNDPGNVISWYDAPSGGNLLESGTNYTFIPTENTTVYAQEGPLFVTSELKVTELSLQFPDILEVTNIGASKDYSGYRIALSDEPYANFNTVNSVVKELGFMTENSTIVFDDVAGSDNYWGSNIWWGEGGNGWIIILDTEDNVVESVFWNASELEISTLDITVDGVALDVSDIEWQGAGADFTEACNSSFRRVGEDDTALNWSSNCLDSDYGVYNTDMELGFQGCLPQRIPAMVTGEEEVPTINCPEDLMITVNQGDFYELPDFATAADAVDNCSFIVNQVPAIGAQLFEGDYTVTLTVVDGAGNQSLCEFNITVDAILSNEPSVLSDQLILTPNPTFGNVNLTYNGDVSLTGIEIIDVNGRSIKKVTPSTSEVTNFSMADLADGFYFVRIMTADNVLVKQVIKK
ncbi:M36 family metallopeptidase [Patiriisocius sp. Uisw_047]|jgi:extracellular elastinolytic metalloproteinase|uniref:M36 family metallopeptidase n=1 Tax=Patiriisocius sp. Uisw_047 TaxID=3230969 RepID=UPI0039EB2257